MFQMPVLGLTFLKHFDKGNCIRKKLWRFLCLNGNIGDLEAFQGLTSLKSL